MTIFKPNIRLLMDSKRLIWLFIACLGCIYTSYGQDVSLFQQFNGRYDFTFIGNTMNTDENNIVHGLPGSCSITTSSSAELVLGSTDTFEKAYLYWAGSGTGDFSIQLNGVDIVSERDFSLFSNFGLPYFSAFKDVTNQVLATGNGVYTVSDLDVSSSLEDYCVNATNFAGWAIVIIYKNSSLPLNQLNVYDGLQGVPDDLVINLSSLNVLDNNNAKAGFIAWEGDSILDTEQFHFNGHPLSNALNPVNNVFNGTNSITGSTDLYNMDLDIYDLQNYIQIGDTTAEIKLSSTQDFIMINTVVTKLNSQLPDATVQIDSIAKTCDSKEITVHYTVFNSNATNPLPANTPIALYANGALIQTTTTPTSIGIDEFLNLQTTLLLPDTITSPYTLSIMVDDLGTGHGIVTELNETNNSTSASDSLLFSPTYNALEPIVACNEGFTQGTFDFSNYDALVKVNPTDTVAFYENIEEATTATNPIVNTTAYIANSTPKKLFVRIQNENCYSITSFDLTTKNCPPTVYNFISANQDGANDDFYIDGLRNIFLNFKIEIYNRWGKLIWTGNQNTDNWDGTVKNGFEFTNAPDGTYFYLLFLNEMDYPEPLKGFLYLNH